MATSAQTGSVTAELIEHLGVGAYTEWRRRVSEAAWGGKICARCGRALRPDEPIWREFPGNRRAGIAPVCEQCRSKKESHWLFRPEGQFTSGPCGGCGRPVTDTQNRFRRLRFCCALCEHAATLARAREQRTNARGTRPCEMCGEMFDPPRTDARFCSSACRQHAYRKRQAVTADECLSGETFESRNAPAPATAANAERSP